MPHERVISLSENISLLVLDENEVNMELYFLFGLAIKHGSLGQGTLLKYHSQIVQSDVKLEWILPSKDMILVHGYHPNICKPHLYPYNA